MGTSRRGPNKKDDGACASKYTPQTKTKLTRTVNSAPLDSAPGPGGPGEERDTDDNAV